MEVPKYIETALRRRVRAALHFLSADDIITEYIDKNDLKVEFDDYNGGIKSLRNPRESAERIILAILEKENKK